MDEIIKGLYVVYGEGIDSNIYLSGDTLVDTGTGMRIEQVWKELKTATRLEKITKVINTHCHADHIGGNRYFGANFYAHEKDADAIRFADPEKTLAPWFPTKLEPLEVVGLKEGGRISVGKIRCEVIHSPGHTEGCMCLYNRKKKILFSGDTVFEGGGFGRTDLPTGNATDLINSIEKLSKLEVDYLLPGHGMYSEHGELDIKQALMYLKA